MSPRRIITSYICPPIPIRSFDWCAMLDGDDDNERAPRGWGVTETDAILDLRDQLQDIDSEAPGYCAGISKETAHGRPVNKEPFTIHPEIEKRMEAANA